MLPKTLRPRGQWRRNYLVTKTRWWTSIDKTRGTKRYWRIRQNDLIENILRG